MLRNIITIAIRILIRNKIFSLINLLGITIGLSCSLLIFDVVSHELSYDRFHVKRNQLFVLQQQLDLGTGPYRTDRCGPACGPALKDAFPEITDYIRFSHPLEFLVIYEQPDSAGVSRRKKFIENAVLPVDSNFLVHFSFPVVKGNPGKALEDPWSMAITAETARKYFAGDDPIGKVLTVDSRHEFTVTAVVEDPPSNSSVKFDFLIPFRFLEKLGRDLTSYSGNPYFTFLCLDEPSLANDLGPKISEYLDDYQDEALPAEQSLVTLTDFHLRGEQRGNIFTTLLTLLGIVILAIACINFMNLTTARYLSRTREVGIRKAVGGRRSQLIGQFIGETMILVLFALILSVLIVDTLVPVFNQMFETEIEFRLGNPVMIGGLIAFFLVTSLVAGSYPAFFLSSVKAVNVFSKYAGSLKRGVGIRKILVVLQFLFTIVFIIATLVNYRQFALLKESGMGLNVENIIYFPVRGELTGRLPEFKQEVLMNPSVRNVTEADFVPRSVDRGELSWGLTAEDKNELALFYPVGYDFAETFGVEVEAGRFYDERMPGDTAHGIIVNRSVANALELEEPVGHTFYLDEEPYVILGIIKNYVFNPLSLSGDKVIMPFKRGCSLCFVKTDNSDPQQVTDYLETLHEKFNPDFPFTPLYLDEYLDPITKSLGDLNKIVYFFTLFGILISCMGLLGLSIFSTEQRTKEIGIRKAMGASSQNILKLVTLEFLKLILIALVIAIPASIFLIRTLLRLFAERIQLGPDLFIIATLIVVLIAFMTISYHSIRSARSNPARNLRYE